MSTLNSCIFIPAVKKEPRVQQKQYDIFISYAHGPGNHIVKKLVNYLQNVRGLRIWFDEKNIEHDMVESMRTGIEQSKCFIAVLSQKYEDSPWCLRETHHAIRMGIPVIPVKVNNYKLAKWCLFMYGHIYYVALQYKKHWKKQIRKLCLTK